MRYDMHVHINIHGDEGEMEKYEYFAKMNRLDVVGFVIHYNPKMSRKELRDYKDFVYSLEINALSGLELYYPLEKIPSGFDFYILHFSNITVDADILSSFRDIIIAHPLSYGMRLANSAIPIIKRNNIGIECNSAHYTSRLQKFYYELKRENITIPFGSDAHTPEEIGAGFEELQGIFSPFEKVKRDLILKKNIFL